MGLFDFLKKRNPDESNGSYLKGFSKTNQKIKNRLDNVYGAIQDKSDNYLEELMIALLEADIGYHTASKICDSFKNTITQEYDVVTKKDINNILYKTMSDIYNYQEVELNINQQGPTVIMMVGVNGAGKTTSIAKLAAQYKEAGKNVAVVAADTFRAGAVKQLQEWANRLEIPCISGRENEDPSSVLVEGARFAKENNIEILLCDTAGRLQNKVNLMKELEKMNRVLNKEIPNAPHETWLVLDANTGQNGLSQAELFNESTKLTGIILTKIDGTSKGGIVIGIKDSINVPVRYIGLGEGIEDLTEFDLDTYLYSILGDLTD